MPSTASAQPARSLFSGLALLQVARNLARRQGRSPIAWPWPAPRVSLFLTLAPRSGASTTRCSRALLLAYLWTYRRRFRAPAPIPCPLRRALLMAPPWLATMVFSPTASSASPTSRATTNGGDVEPRPDARGRPAPASCWIDEAERPARAPVRRRFLGARLHVRRAGGPDLPAGCCLLRPGDRRVPPGEAPAEWPWTIAFRGLGAPLARPPSRSYATRTTCWSAGRPGARGLRRCARGGALARGIPGPRRRAARECAGLRWTLPEATARIPCFYRSYRSEAAPRLPGTRRAGPSSMAEVAVIACRSWSLGRVHKRATLRAYESTKGRGMPPACDAHGGLTDRAAAADPEDRQRSSSDSRGVAGGKGRAEMSFTVGRFSRAASTRSGCFVCRDENEVLAFCTLAAYRGDGGGPLARPSCGKRERRPSSGTNGIFLLRPSLGLASGTRGSPRRSSPTPRSRNVDRARPQGAARARGRSPPSTRKARDSTGTRRSSQFKRKKFAPRWEGPATSGYPGPRPEPAPARGTTPWGPRPFGRGATAKPHHGPALRALALPRGRSRNRRPPSGRASGRFDAEGLFGPPRLRVGLPPRPGQRALRCSASPSTSRLGKAAKSAFSG
jgi:hypothetical protein